MEPFKNLLDPTLVRLAGEHLKRADKRFDRKRFEQLAIDGLVEREMKDRALHIGRALARTLPQDFDRAAALLEATLAPAREEAATPRSGDAGLAGWIVWPMTMFIAEHGLAQPERALAALHAMTQRFTAEWAVRPFILAHPALAYATLTRWSADPSLHVRRLVSEGSRPRLPWGLRLAPLIADPAPNLPLLEALQDDTSEYVRRSVANHLNDIAKDHPAQVVAWLARHLPQAGAQRRALLRHASRGLVKQGHADVLKAWGVGTRLRGTARLTVQPQQVILGGRAVIEAVLESSARRPQALLIDYAVHHVKANGSTSPKVFKGWSLTLAAQEARTLRKTHSLEPITTRRYHAGLHRVELLVNGCAVAEDTFLLTMP